MTPTYFAQNKAKQYIISVLLILVISVICFIISDFIGYRTVALILLATVSILAIFFSVYPVLVAATLSALIWDFFFIPPHYTFHVDNPEDALMLIMYFIIALLNGILTSKIKQYEKVERQKEERQNTIRLYKTLFDSISHELRTPIATIVGATDNLMSKTIKISNENKEKLIEEISIAAFRLNRLVDNLLNMQRLESGMLKLKLDWCDINELINSPINRLEVELSKHPVKIEIEPNFPIIKLDFGLIEQVIFNILHNASIYTPINTTITITANYSVNRTIITISDEGNGFSSKDISKVFTKFYRTSQSKTGGTGLGLSIVKGFVEAHEGTIKVENQPNGGAKFTIDLPTKSLQLKDDFDFTDNLLKQNQAP